MTKFQNNKNRKSQRLSNYDYSQNGLYFITICTKERQELFGKIKNGKMILNECGEIIKNNLTNIPKYFENIFLDAFIVMPNHVHMILEILVGTDLASVRNSDKSQDMAKSQNPGEGQMRGLGQTWGAGQTLFDQRDFGCNQFILYWL